MQARRRISLSTGRRHQPQPQPQPQQPQQPQPQQQQQQPQPQPQQQRQRQQQQQQQPRPQRRRQQGPQQQHQQLYRSAFEIFCADNPQLNNDQAQNTWSRCDNNDLIGNETAQQLRERYHGLANNEYNAYVQRIEGSHASKISVPDRNPF
ncbi:hypothetical protein BC940DRAFT_369534 [Gongronella butleri]|nr:hypothetical protein BC940DRAFT_369534 [Gongronella butleri]